jgi:hypothetical protein
MARHFILWRYLSFFPMGSSGYQRYLPSCCKFQQVLTWVKILSSGHYQKWVHPSIYHFALLLLLVMPSTWDLTPYIKVTKILCFKHKYFLKLLNLPSQTFISWNGLAQLALEWPGMFP